MKSAALRNLVTFERRSATENDFGEQTDVWTEITRDWASIEPISGREFFAAQQTQSDITTRIICRYSSALAAVTAKDRIVYNSTVYDIRHPPINKEMRNRELQFMCTVHA